MQARNIVFTLSVIDVSILGCREFADSQISKIKKKLVTSFLIMNARSMHRKRTKVMFLISFEEKILLIDKNAPKAVSIILCGMHGLKFEKQENLNVLINLNVLNQFKRIISVI